MNLLAPFEAIEAGLQAGLIWLGNLLNQIPLIHQIGGFGLAIILFTLAIRVLLTPLYHAQIRNQRVMQIRNAVLQPKLADLRKKYKNDFRGMREEQMRIQKEIKLSGGSTGLGCVLGILPLAITYPFYFAIRGATTALVGGKPAIPDVHFLWVSNLGQTVQELCCTAQQGGWSGLTTHVPLLVFPVLAGAMTFFQGRMMLPPAGLNTTDTMRNMTELSKRMTMIIPASIIFAGVTLPTGLSVYWVTQYAVILAQQYWLVGGLNLPQWVPGRQWRGRLYEDLDTAARSVGYSWEEFFGEQSGATDDGVSPALRARPISQAQQPAIKGRTDTKGGGRPPSQTNKAVAVTGASGGRNDRSSSGRRKKRR